jgi:serine/threonine-protein kinase
MSPEQVHGKKPDSRTDIYSLGVTLYHMLAGRPPYRGDSAFDLAFQHVQGTPTPLRELRPEVSTELEAIVAKMMAKQPEDRFQTGRDLLRAMAQLSSAATGSVDAAPAPDIIDIEPVSRHSVRGERTDKTEPQAPTQKPKSRLRKKKSNAGVWIGIGAAVVLTPILLVGGIVVGRLAQERQKRAEMAAVSVPPDPEQKAPPPPPDRDKKPPPPPDKALPPPPDRPQPLTQAEKEKEDRLIKALPLFFSPAPASFRKELGAYIELGVFYFEHKHFEDADRYFLGLSRKFKNPQHPVALFSEIGHAIVLSFEGKAKESNQKFMRLASGDLEQYGAVRRLMYFDNLRKWTKDALDLNAKHGPLPSQLVELRKDLNTIK